MLAFILIHIGVTLGEFKNVQCSLTFFVNFPFAKKMVITNLRKVRYLSQNHLKVLLEPINECSWVKFFIIVILT